MLTPQEYYEIVRPLVTYLNIWETTYHQQLEGDNPIVAWTSGSSLRPLLDPLTDDERAAFVQQYTDYVAPHYPKQADGKTIFPFRRIFLGCRKVTPSPCCRVCCRFVGAGRDPPVPPTGGNPSPTAALPSQVGTPTTPPFALREIEGWAGARQRPPPPTLNHPPKTKEAAQRGLPKRPQPPVTPC